MHFKKETVPYSTYNKFKDGILAVEEALLTKSRRLQFMSLVSLCEGLINHILKLQNIPLTYVQDESKRWLKFCEKIETFLLINSPCPLNNLHEYKVTSNIYQNIRNLVIHGNPDVRVTQNDVENLKYMVKHLLKYDIEEMMLNETA